MTPTPTSAVCLPPVVDNIFKKFKPRKVSIGGPSYVLEERKKSVSMVSLLIDENGNERQIKSKSVMHERQLWNDDLALHSQPYRYSDNNHKKKYSSVFDYTRILREERREFEFRLRSTPGATGRPEDFRILNILASGQFGRVYLAEDITEKKHRAIKVISKDVIRRGNLHDEIVSEKNYLYATNSPFIVSLIQHFEDDRSVYFVQEYVGNRDLYEHLNYTGPFSEDLTRFYASQVVLALEYLHNVNLIYRDLKPENVMVDTTGYIKLVDFGLVKRVETTTNSMVGTPAYIAPEVVLRKPYDKSIDWWSFGVVVYEMLAGCQVTPFKGLTRMETYEKIACFTEVKFPSSKSFPRSPVRDLIRRLLQRNPSSRLGSGVHGSSSVKTHPWFASMKWAELYKRSIAPPIKRGSHFRMPKLSFSNNHAVPVKCQNKMDALKQSLLGVRATPGGNVKQIDSIENRIRMEKALKLR